MLKYITESEYLELLEVDNNSIPDNFNQLVIEASSYINRQTLGRINLNKIPKEVKYATCLIVNIINDKEKTLNEMSNLKSQNIEGWSETYQTPEEIKENYSKKMYSVLENNLWNVLGRDNNPLLYKGVC
ncbi:MAG: hypothetical protein IJH39_11575 [Clostridia bacterium]|nr:hypothetical protein [Clostridia bacterium]